MKTLGKVVAIDKVFLTRKELASYLGVTEKLIRERFDLDPDVEIYKYTQKLVFYRKDNIDEVILKCRI